MRKLSEMRWQRMLNVQREYMERAEKAEAQVERLLKLLNGTGVSPNEILKALEGNGEAA